MTGVSRAPLRFRSITDVPATAGTTADATPGTDADAAAVAGPATPGSRRRQRTVAVAALASVAVLVGAALFGSRLLAMPGSGSAAALRVPRAALANPAVDPGTALPGGPAPGFTLTNQFGRRVSLASYHGDAVLLAFIDSQCTTVCPLTTQSMLAAKNLLGAAGERVQLIGVDANPVATSVAAVRAYSAAHGLTNSWNFLTGPLPALRRVWAAYHIQVEIQAGLIDHTPALFLLGPHGRERRVYFTPMFYTGVEQAAQLLAQGLSSLLPGHPPLQRSIGLAYQPGISPAQRVRIPTVLPRGTLTLGPGRAHLVVFFASWLAETSNLTAQLEALNAYQQAAPAAGLPGLAAVDEATTEPPGGLARALAALPAPLRYPVAIDSTGALADGYQVADQPWLVLVSATGRIVWSHDGWLAPPALERAVTAHRGALG